MKIAVLLSGTGRTLENLISQKDIEIALVVSNKQGVRGNHVALSSGIPFLLMEDKSKLDKELFCILEESGIQLVCLAGFLTKIQVPEKWTNKIMNIHPSLLPSFGGKGFYGEKVHKAVLDSGCKVTGCTVHFVDNEYDHGPIVLQKAIEVLPDDTTKTLAERVFTIECQAYPEAIRLYQKGGIKVRNRHSLSN